MSAVEQAMSGVLAFKAGMEEGARELRLRKAVEAAAKELRWGADMANTVVAERLNGMARELELAFAEARKR